MNSLKLAIVLAAVLTAVAGFARSQENPLDPQPGPQVNEGAGGEALARPPLSPELRKMAGLYSLLATVPGAAELTPPEWVKEGVRITYWAGSAIIRNQAGQSTLTEDPAGDLMDPKTGTRYSESSVADGTASAGFTQIDITGVSSEAVVMKVSTFLHDGTIERPSLINVMQALCHPSGCEYWIHPKALAVLASERTIAFAGRRTANGQTRDVVVIRAGNGHTIYDAETGLQLSFSSKTRNTGTETYYDPATGQAQVRAKTGSTLAVNALRGVRETPFGRLAESALPAWVGSLKGVELRMTRTFMMDAGGGQQQNSMTIRMEAVGGGGNWVYLRFTTKVPPQVPGGRAQESVVHAVTIPTEVGCSFLPVEYLRILIQGQVLDRDPITGYTTQVALTGKSADGRSVVVISQEGSDQRTSFTYDATTGLMVSMDKIERVAGSTTRTQLTVVRTW